MSSTIKGQEYIAPIEVFWNQRGFISIKQEADPSFQDDASIIEMDVKRARALIAALRKAIREP